MRFLCDNFFKDCEFNKQDKRMTGVPELDPFTLRQACQTSHYWRNLCEGTHFWRNKIQHDFGKELFKYTPSYIHNYRDYYYYLVQRDHLFEEALKGRLDSLATWTNVNPTRMLDQYEVTKFNSFGPYPMGKIIYYWLIEKGLYPIIINEHDIIYAIHTPYDELMKLCTANPEREQLFCQSQNQTYQEYYEHLNSSS